MIGARLHMTAKIKSVNQRTQIIKRKIQNKYPKVLFLCQTVTNPPREREKKSTINFKEPITVGKMLRFILHTVLRF